MSDVATVADLTERVRARALALGFDRCGFARAGRSRDAARYEAWLAAGRDADLEYMRRRPDRRADPTVVLPGCRTVVVLAVSYAADEPAERPPLAGTIARYARGRDYHKVLAVRLRLLKSALDEEGGPGHRHRWYVDDGPVLERAWAAEAGLGFTGKNACLIDPHAGSWTLLAAVLTTLDLRPDGAVREDCGTCERCIPACPTGAIVAPGEVDARRCISYWTIEHRGTIPEDLRPLLGTRVFGCDDCQTVCPWNRFARPVSIADLRPRALLADGDLARFAAWDEPAWDEATRGTAVRRVGYAGFLRNVAIALGNTGDPRARPHLERLAGHSEPLVREHARWALARLPSPSEDLPA